MINFFRLIFKPILSLFERGDEPYNYRPSQRYILLACSVLFLFLAGVSLYFGLNAGGAGAYIPAIVFFLVGLACLVVSLLGNERAVAKIWGGK
jgi:drug/metabolite transporter (DMT)-like permease